MANPHTPPRENGQRPAVDPRGPRFGAGITAVLLLVVIGLAVPQAANPGASVLDRFAQPATILLAILALLFVWGAAAGIGRHPWGLLFKALVRPRLRPTTEREAPEAPTFAQGVGALVTIVGLLLHLLGVPWALVIAASAAFIAAFLNSVFGYCIGCQLYLLLVRVGAIRRRPVGA